MFLFSITLSFKSYILHSGLLLFLSIFLTIFVPEFSSIRLITKLLFSSKLFSIIILFGRISLIISLLFSSYVFICLIPFGNKLISFIIFPVELSIIFIIFSFPSLSKTCSSLLPSSFIFSILINLPSLSNFFISSFPFSSIDFIILFSSLSFSIVTSLSSSLLFKYFLLTFPSSSISHLT